MLDINKSIFDENLLLTQAYCEQQLKRTQKNYAAILRSFNPVIGGTEIFSFELGRYGEDADGTFLFFAKWNLNPADEANKTLYNELFEKQLQHKRETITEVTDKEFRGKILIAE